MAASGSGSDEKTLVLLSNNIAPSQVKRMSEISEWTYFTRSKGLPLSAFFLSCFAVSFLLISMTVSSANDEVTEFKILYNTDDDIRNSENTTDGGVILSSIASKNTTLNGDPSRVRRLGQFELLIAKDIPKPVYLQYLLEEFFQNHMWYLFYGVSFLGISEW